MSSRREQGSALIESVVIGSAIFLIVVTAVVSSIRIAISGSEANEAARAGAVHAARHDDVASAEAVSRSLFPGIDIDVRREADSVVVTAVAPVVLPHPGGSIRGHVTGRARMPLAPFRSDHG